MDFAWLSVSNSACGIMRVEALMVRLVKEANMISRKEYKAAQIKAASMIRRAGILITDPEAANIEIVDFGLGDLAKEGVQILTLVATERVAVKILVLFADQTEPEHWHPPVGEDPGKEESIRIVDGTVRFYIPGAGNIKYGILPEGKEEYYTARHEIIMQPGDQLTLQPGTKHWFQSGDRGAVMYSFSTCARDGIDQFTDPKIKRVPPMFNAE